VAGLRHNNQLTGYAVYILQTKNPGDLARHALSPPVARRSRQNRRPKESYRGFGMSSNLPFNAQSGS
jgi:hypothetical protein